MPDVGEVQTYKEMVAPIVAKCELAAKLNMNASFDPVGAAALAQVLKNMSEVLDGLPLESN